MLAADVHVADDPEDARVSFRDLRRGLNALDLDPGRPIIAHASLSSFGEVRGGPETVLGALLTQFDALLMPTFTYKTMVIPEVGPPKNALQYGEGETLNRMAEIYRPDMPADGLMGQLPETLRRHPRARRSNHPILSFAGIGVARALESQTLEDPLAPIQELAEAGGWVLLLGVNHTVNTSLHYAERLAGRPGFVRWALTTEGVVTCPGFPGCSEGFQAVGPRLTGVTRQVRIGAASVRAIPLPDLIRIAREWIEAEPLALLCEAADCPRCSAQRASVRGDAGGVSV